MFEYSHVISTIKVNMGDTGEEIQSDYKVTDLLLEYRLYNMSGFVVLGNNTGLQFQNL